ncbi:hypothetical protein MMC30_007581 [Trapelia coarctata]|nr:hypothetical protein [Trapelia coarctata]
MEASESAERITQARSTFDVTQRSKNSNIPKAQTIPDSTVGPSESCVNAPSSKGSGTAPENLSFLGKPKQQNNKQRPGEKGIEDEGFSQHGSSAACAMGDDKDSIHEGSSEAKKNEPVVAEPREKKRFRSKKGSAEGFPYKAEEEKSRACMFANLEVDDPDHRKAISSALKKLRHTSQWRLGSLEERKLPTNEGGGSRGVKFQPRKRKWLGILASSTSTSSASLATEGADTERSSTAAWVRSLETPPTENELDGWNDGPARKRTSRAVTGVLRDFTQPFASVTLPEEGPTVKPPSSTRPEGASKDEDHSDEDE